MCEFDARIYGKKDDRIVVKESILLNGANARGLAKSRIVSSDRCQSEVIGEAVGNAPYARGHVDCVEIIKGKEARASAINAGTVKDQAQAENMLNGALKTLFAVAENYPELKADANFRDLTQKLVEIEDALQYARRFYNGAVKQYMTRVESFPDLLVARLFGFGPMPFFETDEREAVKVAL